MSAVSSGFYIRLLVRCVDLVRRFAALVTMAAVAAITKNVRVGCMMFCTLFRSPGLLAKSVVTLDHISGGRVELGLGAGWFEEEFQEFGYAFPPVKERLDEFEEGLTMIRPRFNDPVTHFKGE